MQKNDKLALELQKLRDRCPVRNHRLKGMGRDYSRELREKEEAFELQTKGIRSSHKHMRTANKKKRGVLVEREKKNIFFGSFKNMTPRQVKRKKQERLKNRSK